MIGGKDVSVPRPVSSLPAVRHASLGTWHGAAVAVDGAVYGWGLGAWSGLGVVGMEQHAAAAAAATAANDDDATANPTTPTKKAGPPRHSVLWDPVQISTDVLPPCSTISCSSCHDAITSSLPLPDVAAAPSPLKRRFSGGADAAPAISNRGSGFFSGGKSVLGFGAHTAVVAEDGRVFTWGANVNGKLGHAAHQDCAGDGVGQPRECIYRSAIPGASDAEGKAVRVVASVQHTVVVTERGDVVVLGGSSDAFNEQTPFSLREEGDGEGSGSGGGDGGGSDGDDGDEAGSRGGGQARLVHALDALAVKVTQVAVGCDHVLAVGLVDASADLSRSPTVRTIKRSIRRIGGGGGGGGGRQPGGRQGRKVLAHAVTV